MSARSIVINDHTLEKVAESGYRSVSFDDCPWHNAPAYVREVWKDASRLQIGAYVATERPWIGAVHRLARVIFELCRYSALALVAVAGWFWWTYGSAVWSISSSAPYHATIYLPLIPAAVLFCFGWAVLYIVTGEQLIETPVRKPDGWERWLGGATVGFMLGIVLATLSPRL